MFISGIPQGKGARGPPRAKCEGCGWMRSGSPKEREGWVELRMPFLWALDSGALSESSFLAHPGPRLVSGMSQAHRLSHT